MNRQIKFRGQCTICNEWIEGDLIHGVGTHSDRMFILPNQVNLAYVEHCDPLNGVRVMPETVGQFTGLLDKNLKEIYEGDILKVQWEKDSIGGYMQSSDGYIEKEETVIVEWMNIGWGFKKKDGKFTSLPKNCTMEVIGNIYENKELLNQ